MRVGGRWSGVTEPRVRFLHEISENLSEICNFGNFMHVAEVSLLLKFTG